MVLLLSNLKLKYNLDSVLNNKIGVKQNQECRQLLFIAVFLQAQACTPFSGKTASGSKNHF